MKSKKSTGLDKINCKLLKMAAPYIVDSLTYVYNLFIHTAIIPDVLKCAKCVPIHKAGDLLTYLLLVRQMDNPESLMKAAVL